MLQKEEHTMVSANIHYMLLLRDIHKRHLSLKDADEEQNKLFNYSKDIDKGRKPVEKRSFLNKVGLFLSAREKIINNFKNKNFK